MSEKTPKLEGENAMLSAEEWKKKLHDSTLEEISDELNKAGCNNYSQHPLKDAIGDLIDERYPTAEGWVIKTGNSGYYDPWWRSRDGIGVGIECDEQQDGHFKWYGYSEKK